MHKTSLLLVAMLCFISCGGDGSSSDTQAPPRTVTQVTLATVATGFNAPLDIEQPADNSSRLFVVEQKGLIRILQNGSIASTPFLDITSKVVSGGEMGLLGLTFHPNFSQNGRFFVNYTRNNQGQIQTVISEFRVSSINPSVADPNSERMLLIVDQPFQNHKAGQLAFGPDGFLYFGLGDGGSEGDPFGNGQNTGVPLGKMLRIDVDGSPASGKAYAIPPDNPFVSGGGLPEIFAFGFRNPWRFSFDVQTNRLFVADVGQDRFEEIDLVTKGGNYGWNIMEGSHCLNPPQNCNTNGLTLPIFDYSHSDGFSVIGGFVYRGSAIPNLQGAYVFGDFGSGKIWMLRQDANNNWTRTELLSTGRNISSFGRDQSGELYVVDYAGAILQLRSM